MTETVHICEVGPRDGLQIARSRMTTPAKLRWIEAMAAAGVAEIEVGSFVPPRVIPHMADTEEVVRAAIGIPGLTVIALVPNLRGAQRAYAAGAHKISTPVSVSDGHSHANLNRAPAESVAEVGRIVEWVRTQPRRMEVIAGVSTAFGCSIDGVVPLGRTVEIARGLAGAGVDKVTLADTVGYAHPAQVKRTVREVRAAIGPTLWGLHLHDTMGLGLANALAGLEEGIRAFDSCQGGLGGCPYAPGASGNVVTEDLVFMLESMGFATGIDLPKLFEARAVLHEGLPEEELHGQVAKAGIPRTFKRQDGPNESALTRFRTAVTELYGERVERVVLYGSRARGEHRADSDYDVAVFLRDMPERAIEMARLAEVETDILYDTGAVINALPLPACAWRERTGFMSELRKDGLDL